jgi:Fe-S-cluster containining protein
VAAVSEPSIDLTQLEGWRFDERACATCGLCCLCQPELLEAEAPLFRQKHRARTVAKKHPHEHFALAMKKGVGSCAFLQKKRCSIYPERPYFCRAFPLHVHVGERAQVVLDLSCRGVWTGQGEDALAIGLGWSREARGRISAVSRQARSVYAEYLENCREQGMDASASRLRGMAAPLLRRMVEVPFLAQLLEATMADEPVDPSALKEAPFAGEQAEAFDSEAREGGMDSLTCGSAFDAPVYCAEDGSWNIFMSEAGRLSHRVLDEDGDLAEAGRVEPGGLHLLPPEGDGLGLMLSYLETLNRRDCLLGSAYAIHDENGYEDEAENVYLGVLATAAVELMWRMNLLDRVFGTGRGRRGVREAIIYYDMDRLDAPSIGAFV